jgi:hypothetical protein
MAKSKTKSTKKANLDNLNEIGKRTGKDRRENKETVAHTPERRKAKRRRQIDPTTCEREYNEAEIEFMHALDEYKRASGRMFPTCSEILEVVMGLGYRQVAERSEGFSMDDEANGDDQPEFDAEDFDAETLEEEMEDQVI